MTKKDILFYIKSLHGKSKGYITKAIINEIGYTQCHFKITKLIDSSFEGENIYISINTFSRPIRKIEFLKELNAFFIDIDTYNTQYTNDQVLENLYDNYFGKTMPMPSFIIQSGKGLYLIWLIDSPPASTLPLWNVIQRYLYEQLKELGADRKCLDCTRILRVPGSINSKNGAMVKTILPVYPEHRYSLREIQEQYLPELKEKRKKKRGRPLKRVSALNIYTLYYSRAKDLVKLCEMRDYDVEGFREIILFLYRHWTCCFTENEKKALEDALELNMKFKKPLSKKEVIKATESAEKVYKNKTKEYKYKNNTLIDMLCISEDEQKQLSTIVGKAEVKARKKLRNKKDYSKKLKKQGKLTKQEEIKMQREKIKDLYQQGLLQEDISNILNLSLRTVKRRINELKDIILKNL